MLRVLALLLLTTPALARERRDLPDASEVRLPAGQEEFRFGAGDRFKVSVYQHADLDSELTVAPDGSVTFPLLGRVVVAGRSYAELVAELESGFRAYYTDASVAVNVVEVTNRKVFVVGEVLSPSVLQITGEMRVLEALVRTGGINPNARTDNLLVVRAAEGSPEVFTVDVDRILSGDLAQNVPLQAGDIVVVPARTIVNAERFFRHVQGILSPLVAASQIYRNVAMTSGTSIIEDPTTEP